MSTQEQLAPVTPVVPEDIKAQIESYLTEKQSAKDVCVAFCSPHMIHAKFVESLVTLLQSHPRVGWVSQTICGPAMSQARASQVDGFLTETPAKYLFMVDSDMVFEPEDLTALLALADKQHLADKPRVYSGLYVDSFGRPVCGDWDEGKTAYHPLDTPPKKPTRVGAAGAGFLLIPRRVFDYVGPSYAFNEIVHGANDEKLMGEDVSFSRRLDDSHLELYVHPDVQLGHCKETMIYPDGTRLPI